MTADGKMVPKDQLRKKALANGVPRNQAWVLAIMAFFSQWKGGVTLGAGPPWQWREYRDIAEETGYSIKSVGRAVASLKSQKLIEVRRIWNPCKTGQSVNAFRITASARAMLQLWPSQAVQSPKNGVLGKDISASANGASCLLARRLRSLQTRQAGTQNA